MNYTRREESWLPGLTAASRDEALESILKHLCDESFYSVNSELTHESVLNALIRREAQRTTAVGSEIAFPHARLERLSKALFAVAVLKEPVMFDAFPVRIICLILVPASEPTVSLKMMSQISHILIDNDLCGQVMEAKTPAELRRIFSESNPQIDKPIMASDIMRPPRFSVQKSDPVSVCSHIMSVNNLQAVPVVDEAQKIVGEITVEALFRYGLPDFFSKLKSVSFIAEFDPFEKYFEDERETSACSMMKDRPRIVPMNYTLMEIVFDLAIKSCPKLYVVDGADRWVGTIDRGLVLDNVINH